jgi:hypothetical protein
MSSQVKGILLGGLENVVGFKFLALVLASVFFAVGKLPDHLWVEIVFVVTGLRAATDISQIMKAPAGPQVVNVENKQAGE